MHLDVRLHIKQIEMLNGAGDKKPTTEEEDVDRLIDEINVLTNERDDARAKVTELAATCNSLTARLENVNKRLDAEVSANNAERERYSRAHTNTQHLNNEIAKANARRDSAEAGMKFAGDQVQMLEEDIKAYRDKLANLQQLQPMLAPVQQMLESCQSRLERTDVTLHFRDKEISLAFFNWVSTMQRSVALNKLVATTPQTPVEDTE